MATSPWVMNQNISPGLAACVAPLASDGMLPVPWAFAPWQGAQLCRYSDWPALAFCCPVYGSFSAPRRQARYESSGPERATMQPWHWQRRLNERSGALQRAFLISMVLSCIQGVDLAVWGHPSKTHLPSKRLINRASHRIPFSSAHDPARDFCEIHVPLPAKMIFIPRG